MGWTDWLTTSWASGLWDRLKLPRRFTRDLMIGLLVGIGFSLSSTSLALLVQNRRRNRAVARIPPRPIEIRSDEIVNGVVGLIGQAWHRSVRDGTATEAAQAIHPWCGSTR